MKNCTLYLVTVLGLVLCGSQSSLAAFGNKDRVKLKDIDVLTLYSDRYTTGRRSQPIPQLKCVGGTAGCNAFKPQVVQCYNRGSDGYDIQWECKTDMDNAYRFGRVEVACEGYDYPEDPYVLRGSCGLEYTVDLTKEGHEQQNKYRHSYYGNSGHHHQRQHKSWGNMFQFPMNMVKKGTSMFGDLIFLAVIAVFIYVIYRTCIASGTPTNTNYAAPPDPPPYSEYRQHASAPPPPPPPGFRHEYMPSGGPTYTESTSSQSTSTGGGGWWSGFTTGGLLGYLFGNNTNRSYDNQHYNRRGWGSGWGNGWGSGWGKGWGSGSSWGSGGSGRCSSEHSTSRGHNSGSGGGSSTGTRTASGFGGTRRR